LITANSASKEGKFTDEGDVSRKEFNPSEKEAWIATACRTKGANVGAGKARNRNDARLRFHS